ncbi:hypothetical protein BDQ17DRAFT_1425873 [Cyathus striatus]|nr:hypothetical protein BDQ17DRAFT_1425873 [Cyathus striatus]
MSAVKKAEQEIQTLKTQLDEERRLRMEAEQALKDVRRECMEPFIVPALFDAFLSVSKLTTKLLGRARTYTLGLVA